jgi:hypothetical protein
MLDDFLQEEMNTESATIPIGGNGDFIKIKPANDKDFERERAKRMKRHKQAIKKDRLKDEVIQIELSPLIAEHLLIDWQLSTAPATAKKLFPSIKVKKTDDDDRVLIPFSAENATQVLSHKLNFEFFAYCLTQAKETANFVEEDREDDAKN